jgi:hypothetical protein
VIHGINMPETQSLNPVRVERIEDPEAQCSANAPSAMLKEGRQWQRPPFALAIDTTAMMPPCLKVGLHKGN